MKYQIIKTKACDGNGHTPLNYCVWDKSCTDVGKSCAHLYDDVNKAYRIANTVSSYPYCCCEIGVKEVEI